MTDELDDTLAWMREQVEQADQQLAPKPKPMNEAIADLQAELKRTMQEFAASHPSEVLRNIITKYMTVTDTLHELVLEQAVITTRKDAITEMMVKLGRTDS